MLTIVKVGPDPYDRGERTVFYTDSSIGDGKEVFYLWACHWLKDHPDIPIPPDGFDIRPKAKPIFPHKEPGSCVPWVLTPIGTRSRTGEHDPRENRV